MINYEYKGQMPDDKKIRNPIKHSLVISYMIIVFIIDNCRSI